MDITLFNADDANEAKQWDAFVAQCFNATFLHTRRFLSYHGDRFNDCSAWIKDEQGKVVGVFPAATLPADDDIVCSHPGASYGGICSGKNLRGEAVLQALEALCGYYRGRGYRKLLYKAVPTIYHAPPTEDDRYALFRLNAALVRRDVNAAVSPLHPPHFSERRRRGIKQAEKAGVEVEMLHSADGDFAAAWALIKKNLHEVHNLQPAHSDAEIAELLARFPDNMHTRIAKMKGEVIAAVIFFHTRTVLHAQYIGSNAEGRQYSALDAIFSACIGSAQRNNLWFSFGISTDHEGRELNNGLHEFKIGFGAGATVHDFYAIDLQ